MGKKFNSLEVSAWVNNTTYSEWFNRFYSIAISVFEWINLPASIDERFLEMVLFWNGQAVFFKDDTIGELALPVLAIGPLNIYAIPKQRTAYSFNGYQSQPLSETDSVIIYNNYTRTRDAGQIQMYARRIYEIERSIDTNVKAQKTPVLVECDDKSKLSLLNVYEQYDGNIPVIFGTKNMLNDSIKTINTGAPYVADKLQTLKRQYYQEALTFLGVEANNSEKQERQVEGELVSNMGGTEASRLTRLNARKQACKQINELFGLNIDCRFRSNLTLSKIMEGAENVEIYNDASELV